MELLQLVQKEYKTIQFTIQDSAGDVVDVSSATFALSVRTDPTATTEEFSKADGDFDKTDASSGIVTVDFTDTDLDINGLFYGILSTTQGSAVDKNIFKMTVNEVGDIV